MKTKRNPHPPVPATKPNRPNDFWWNSRAYRREVQTSHGAHGPDGFSVQIIQCKGNKPVHTLAVVFSGKHNSEVEALRMANLIANAPDIIPCFTDRGVTGIIDRRALPRSDAEPMVWPDEWHELPVPTDEAEEPTNPEYWDAYEEAKDLREAVFKHLSPTNPLRLIFQHAMPRDGMDDSPLPALSSLRTAAAFFAKLPESEQRRLLNGWRYDPPWERGDRKDLERDCEEGQLRVFAHLAVSADGSVGKGIHETLCVGSFHAVQVNILRGTTREVAIQGLKRIIEKVENDWDRIITDDEMRSNTIFEHRRRCGLPPLKQEGGAK